MATDKQVHFGHFIFWKRVEKGLSYRELSEAADISQPMLFAYEERATPQGLTSTNYGKLARGLGISLAELDEWQAKAVKPMPPRRKRPAAEESELNVRRVKPLSDRELALARKMEELKGMTDEQIKAYAIRRMLEEQRELPAGAAPPPPTTKPVPKPKKPTAPPSASKHVN